MSGQPTPLDVLRRWLDAKGQRRSQEVNDALAQVETLAEAARVVSETERTGVLPDFQPLADALAPFVGQPGDEAT